jgi:hypothetical protein
VNTVMPRRYFAGNQPTPIVDGAAFLKADPFCPVMRSPNV